MANPPPHYHTYTYTNAHSHTSLGFGNYDLVHPNDAGYAVVAENWYEIVQQVNTNDATAICQSASPTAVDRGR